METKYIFIVIAVLAIFMLAAQQSTVSAQQNTICQDYDFKVHINTAPVTIDFYIGDELFKTVPSPNQDITTHLHCGYEYKIIYKAEGYQTYEETFDVKKAMPINPETRTINLIKIGGNNQ